MLQNEMSQLIDRHSSITSTNIIIITEKTEADFMSNVQKYDAIIIGAGQAGGPLSTALAQAGWKTALVEKEHVGGTCVNEGCTPTKTMVASARVAYLTGRASDYGVKTGPPSIDMSRVRERKRAIVNSFRNSSQKYMEGTEGLDLIFGDGRFAGSGEVEVDLKEGGKRKLTAEKIFINTGAYPVRPPIQGLDRVDTLDSTSIMELDQVPAHLLVLGGGYVGLEFGQMFRRFGSRVTIVQHGKQLLNREDEDVAEEVAKILRDDGIDIMLESSVVKAEQSAHGKVEITVETSGRKKNIAGSHLLVAVGRAPSTEWLSLDAAGVKTDERGFVTVGEKLETSAPGIYAMGDVKGGPAFTHISYDDFRILRTNLLQGGNATTKGRLVPYTVFIDPQLGRVGLSEKEARNAGIAYCVAKMPMTRVARALEVDETRGFMKAIADPKTGHILGAAILGMDGGEIASVIQMAMMGNVSFMTIRDGVFAHPTLSESLNNLFMAVDQEKRKTCFYPNR
jgi:pyruvate/2-oxoglutarate dehydrogenase complex dihydrolipoamide dehydrogenase (E3) component